MAETNQTTTAKKTTTKRTTTKKTPKPAAETATSEVVAQNPLLDLLNGLTPEQLANLVALAQQPKGEPVTETVAEPTKPKKITKSYLNSIRDREVEVRNVVNGRVTYHSQKTGVTYVWTQKGDIEVMTIAEILTMHGKSQKFLMTPWLVVEDEEVVQGLGLQYAMESADLLESLDEFLDEPYHVLKNRVDRLTLDQKNQLADQISLKIQNSELRDIVLIRNLQTLLNKEFLEIK